MHILSLDPHNTAGGGLGGSNQGHCHFLAARGIPTHTLLENGTAKIWTYAVVVLIPILYFLLHLFLIESNNQNLNLYFYKNVRT